MKKVVYWCDVAFGSVGGIGTTLGLISNFIELTLLSGFIMFFGMLNAIALQEDK